MGEPLSLMYGIDLPARRLAEVPAEMDRTLFMVGTLSLKQENQLCLLEVDDDWLQISKRSFAHPAGEIWNLAGSPTDVNILATCYNHVDDVCRSAAGLWSIDVATSSLISRATFNPPDVSAKCTAFEFHPSGSSAAVIAGDRVHIVDFAEAMKASRSLTMDANAHVHAVAWNPHSNGNTVAAAVDGNVRGTDLRTSEDAFVIANANLPNVRNMDFNPNVQHVLATCGDDCMVSLWDIRKTDKPLKTLRDHSHWVWMVRFNPIHDQLILSASSDYRLILNSVTSLSSEAVDVADLTADEAVSDSHKILGDMRLEKVEEHEESVYSCAWAANDPWVFASLSYDGRVIVSRVKRHHKYAILQL